MRSTFWPPGIARRVVALFSARKIRIYVAGLLAMGMISAVAALTTQTASAADHTISIKNVQYNPNSLTINAGDSVTWVNNESDGTVHSSTSDDGLWNSPDLSPGSTFSFTFTTAGTFSFHCRFHTSMTGTITVVGGSGGPPPPPPPPPSSTTTTPPVTTTTTAPSTTTTQKSSGGGGSVTTTTLDPNWRGFDPTPCSPQ